MWLWVLSEIFEEAATAREGRDAVIAFVKKHCKKDKIIPGGLPRGREGVCTVVDLFLRAAC
jgi:hypothetical protein